MAPASRAPPRHLGWCNAAAGDAAIPGGAQQPRADTWSLDDDNVREDDDGEVWAERFKRYSKVSIGAASLLMLNQAIARFFALRNIAFSPPLAGMIFTITALCSVKALGGRAGHAVDNIVDFYEPLRNWVARWMPIFFVPSLIVLPRAAADIAGSEMAKMVGITVVGWLASIVTAVFILKWIRGTVHSEITEEEVRFRSRELS